MRDMNGLMFRPTPFSWRSTGRRRTLVRSAAPWSIRKDRAIQGCEGMRSYSVLMDGYSGAIGAPPLCGASFWAEFAAMADRQWLYQQCIARDEYDRDTYQRQIAGCSEQAAPRKSDVSVHRWKQRKVLGRLAPFASGTTR